MSELRITLTGTYTALPDDYDTDDPKRMAEIDLSNYTSGSVELADMVEWVEGEWSVTIEPATGAVTEDDGEPSEAQLHRHYNKGGSSVGESDG